MSLDLNSSGSLSPIRVRTIGSRRPDDHEIVYIGVSEMLMDKFCELVQKIIDGHMDVYAKPFHVQFLNPYLAFESKEESFSISMADFYEMVRYVLSNTDIYIPLDPRPGLFDWMTQQNPNGSSLDEERTFFLRHVKSDESGVMPGFNHGSLRLQISR